MTSLRLITWNCRSGSLRARLSQLAGFSPHVAFLQECDPTETLPVADQICSRRISSRKGIALIVSSPDYHCVELGTRAGGGAMIAATVDGHASFFVLGVWAQAPDYVGDVLRALDAHADLLQAGPAVVMGDFNSGSALVDAPTPTRGHQRIVDALADLGLVSAYHAFHRVEHGQEAHPTYLHQFKPSQPWHIDFCFVPDSWAPSILNVQVIDGDEWPARSDHRALLVEMEISA